MGASGPSRAWAAARQARSLSAAERKTSSPGVWPRSTAASTSLPSASLRAQEMHGGLALIGACRRLEVERQAGDDQPDEIGPRGDLLVQAAGRVDEGAAELAHGHDALADLVGDQHDRPQAPVEHGQQAVGGLSDLQLGQQEVGHPQGEAVDQDGAARPGETPPGSREVERLLDRQPGVTAPCPVPADPFLHLAVQRLGGGDVDRLEARAQDKCLGVSALARAGAAEDQGGGRRIERQDAAPSGRSVRLETPGRWRGL